MRNIGAIERGIDGVIREMNRQKSASFKTGNLGNEAACVILTLPDIFDQA